MRRIVQKPLLNFVDTDIADLAALLRLPVDDEQVVRFLGPFLSKIKRSAYYGFIVLKGDGLDVVFNEAPWVIPEAEIVDPKRLYLCAFHLHRDGHSGYPQYRGKLPNGVAFGDSEADLIDKMGEPFATGGGGMSSVPPKLPIPRWLKYGMGGGAILHFQLDGHDRIDMVTLMTPDVRPKPA
jgi:hypothetical protein